MKINNLFSAIYLLWISIVSTIQTNQPVFEIEFQAAAGDPIFPPSLMNIFNDMMQQTFDAPPQHQRHFEEYMQKKKQRRKKLHKNKQQTLEQKQFDDIIEKQLEKAAEYKEKAEQLKNLNKEQAETSQNVQEIIPIIKEEIPQNLPILEEDEKQLEKKFEQELVEQLNLNKTNNNMITSTVIGDLPDNQISQQNVTSSNSNLNQINNTEQNEGFQKYYKFYLGDSYKIYFILICVVLIAIIVIIKSGKALIEALTNRRKRYQGLPQDKTTKRDTETLI